MNIFNKLKKKLQKRNKVVYNDRNTSLDRAMLQPLEARCMYDAALGVELANIFTPQDSNQTPDADFVDSNASAAQPNHVLDAFLNTTKISNQDINIVTNPNDGGVDHLVVTSDFHDYYSYDKSLVKEVLFVDSAVDNYAELIDDIDLNKIISGELEVVILDSKIGGVEQISQYLDQFDHQLESVHIVSHGNVAELQLGTDILNNSSLTEHTADLAAWGASFAIGADILFYGCNVAEGVAGQKFVQDLHDIIGTDIAASSDLTGHVDLGGDWELESQTGIIQANNVFNNNVLNFASVLATFTVTNINDSGAGSLRDAITQANSNAGADTIDFDLDVADDTADGNVDGKYTITLLSSLAIPSDITIDGTTASGYSVGSPAVVLKYSGNQLNINTVANVTIQGLEFFKTDAGVLFNFSQLTNFTFDHNISNAVFASSAGATISTNVHITNNIFNASNGGNLFPGFGHTYLIYFNRPVQSVDISDNVFSNIDGGIYFNTGSNLSTGVIKNNDFGSNSDIRIRVGASPYSYLDISENNVGSLIINESFVANDAGDADSGNNFIQNYPVINDVDQYGNNVVISGILDTELNNDYRLEFFGVNNSGPNAGKRFYLGNYTLANVLNANQAFDALINISDAITDGLYTSDYGVYATATRITNLPVSPAGAVGATSSLSSIYNSVTVSSYDIPVTTLIDENDGDTSSINNLFANPGGTGISLREAIIASNNQAGIQVIGFNVAGTINLNYDNPSNGVPDQIDITEGVIIDGTTAPGYSGTPVVTLTSAAIFQNGYGGLVFSNADGSAVKGLGFQLVMASGSPNFALNFYDTSDVIITDNVFGNPAGNNSNTILGVQFRNTYDNITIENNTFQNSLRSAMVFFGNFTDVNILNNTVKNIGANTHPIVFHAGANNVNALVSGNTIYNEIGQPQPALGGIGVGVNGFTGINIEVTQNISYDIVSTHTITAIDYRTSAAGNPATTQTGPQANDVDDANLATDNLLNYPVITKVEDFGSGYYRISGYVDTASTDENRYRLEFFADDNITRPQAQVYVGSLLLNNSNSSLVNGIGATQDRSFIFITSDLSASGLTLSNIRFAVSNTDTTLGHTSELPGGTVAAITPDTIYVTTTDDELDISNGTGATMIDTILSPGGNGVSFREAIYVANNTSGTQTIKFNVSGDYVFSIEAAGSYKLPQITDVVMIDGTSAPGYVAPVAPVDPNSPSNATQTGASGLHGVNTTASANPSNSTESLLGGVIGSTLDIYDSNNDYESDIKSALNTSGNIKVFFENTGQGGGTLSILNFSSSASGSIVQGVGFSRGASTTSSAILGNTTSHNIDVRGSYIEGAFTTGLSYVDEVTNSVFNGVPTGISNGGVINHNTLIQTTGDAVFRTGNVYYSKFQNFGARFGLGDGFEQPQGSFEGNYFDGLNRVGRGSVSFIANEALNMQNTGTTIWLEGGGYTYKNKIHDNAGTAIYVSINGANTINRVGSHSENSLYNNGGLGIDTVVTGDAVGLNSNDYNDTDVYRQNTPYIGTITQVDDGNGGISVGTGDQGDILITGSLNSKAGQFRIDFYANTGLLSGNAANSEAELFLGSILVDTSTTSIGDNGYFQFHYDADSLQAGAIPNVILTPGSTIVATATGNVVNQLTASAATFGSVAGSYETSEFSTIYASFTTATALPLPSSFVPTIDYTGVITVGNYLTNDTTPVLLGSMYQPYEANIDIKIYRIDDNIGGETLVHTATPGNVTKDFVNGTWQYDLTSYFTAPVGAYRMEVTINDGNSAIQSTPGTTFSNMFVVSTDANNMGLSGDTVYNNNTSNNTAHGSTADSANPLFIEIDTGDGNGTQFLQVTPNGSSNWLLGANPTFNTVSEYMVSYTLHGFDNSGNYDSQLVSNGFVVDLTDPTVTINPISGLATSPELTGSYVEPSELVSVLVSIAPTGTLDVNNLNANYTFGINATSVNPSYHNVTGTINTVNDTWTIDAGQITGLSSGVTYDVVAFGVDAAGNITVLNSGLINTGGIVVTQTSSAVTDQLLSSLSNILDNSYSQQNGNFSLTGTEGNDVISPNYGSLTESAYAAALSARAAADQAQLEAEQAMARAMANSGDADLMARAQAAQQAAQVAESAAQAAEAQAAQTQAAEAQGDTASASASAQAAQAAANAAQSASDSAASGGAAPASAGLAGFVQAFGNVTTGATDSAGKVANLVASISWNTMLNQPAEAASAAIAGFTVTLTAIIGSQVVTVTTASGSIGSGGALGLFQNTIGSVFQNLGSNMFRMGGISSVKAPNVASTGQKMSEGMFSQQDFNQEQDVNLSDVTDCVLSNYVNRIAN